MTNQTKAFDFAELDLAAACDVPFEFELLHPATQEGLGVFFSIVGAESASYQNYAREQANKARRKAFGAKASSEVTTVEAETEILVDAIVSCVKGWRTVKAGKSEPVIYLGGDALEFNQANARKILANPGYAWAVRQINAQTGELGNFIKN